MEQCLQWKTWGKPGSSRGRHGIKPALLLCVLFFIHSLWLSSGTLFTMTHRLYNSCVTEVKDRPLETENISNRCVPQMPPNKAGACLSHSLKQIEDLSNQCWRLKFTATPPTGWGLGANLLGANLLGANLLGANLLVSPCLLLRSYSTTSVYDSATNL